MRALRTVEIDGFEIVVSLSDHICDPMASRAAAKKRLGEGATYRELIVEMSRAPEYFANIQGQVNISDEEASALEITLHKATRYERVTGSAEIICDNRGRVWCLYDGAWEHGEIDRLGDSLPDGAIWREDLSVAQLRTIHEQEELEKIAMLAPESRIQASEVEIAAAKRSAVIRRMEAEVVEDPEGLDDARRWYKSEIARIQTKYNLPRAQENGES
jgi:hypothetical protein